MMCEDGIERVFCKDCKHLLCEQEYNEEGGCILFYICSSPKNNNVIYNWYEKSEDNVMIRPQEKNKNNDCEWYEKDKD